VSVVRFVNRQLGHSAGWPALFFLLAVCWPWSVPAAATVDEAGIAETIRRSVEQLRSTGEVTVAGRRLLSAQALPEIYEARGFRQLWLDPANEEALLGEIAAASGDGLDPADYHFTAIREALERRRQERDSARAVAAADLLMTDALVRLVAHFQLGKLDPESRLPRWDLAGQIRREPAAALVTRMAIGDALALQLAELRPVQPLYGRYKSALARYRLIQQQGGWDPIPPGRVLQPGMEDARVPLLRQRLARSGDFPGVVTDSRHFEPALEVGLRRFQGRHWLEADGMLGPVTLRELNRSVEERIDQLKANLERARWLLGEVRGRFLVVDPAGRRVVLMDNSQPILSQRATFAPAARYAGEFRASLRYLVANPDWILPSQLVEAQVAPLARRDPAQLDHLGLQVFDQAGNVIDASRADWSRPSRLIVRQLPGPRSFLGMLRFSMPNPAHVFLHGGPAEGASLAGSVRLEDPVALARALGRPPAPWTEARLSASLAAGEPTTLPLGQALPVLFGPWSAWVETDGTVSLRPGYERHDAAIIAGLRRGAGR
jgi:L,D-transpeptidase YcbB